MLIGFCLSPYSDMNKNVLKEHSKAFSVVMGKAKEKLAQVTSRIFHDIVNTLLNTETPFSNP